MPIHKKIAKRFKKANQKYKAKQFKTPKQQMEMAAKYGAPSVKAATKAGYTALQARKQKAAAKKRKGLESPKGLGSAAYKRISKLKTKKFVLKKPKKRVRVNEQAKGMGIQTAAIKSAKAKAKKKVVSKAVVKAKNQSWKKATTASKKSGVKMTDLIKKRNASKKGTVAYVTAQNKINKFYGSKKVHKVKKSVLKKALKKGVKNGKGHTKVIMNVAKPNRKALQAELKALKIKRAKLVAGRKKNGGKKTVIKNGSKKTVVRNKHQQKGFKKTAKKTPKKKKTLYQWFSGGKTAAQHRKERKNKRVKRSSGKSTKSMYGRQKR